MRCGHGGLAEEGECAFRANHYMSDDIPGVGEYGKRQQVEAGDVFDGIFIADALAQFAVGLDFVADGLDVGDEAAHGGMQLGAGTGAVGGGVDHSAVGKDDARRAYYLVGIGMCAAVHARGIVDDDAAHHGRSLRRGVGGEHASVGTQDFVYSRADYAGWRVISEASSLIL